jgi:hypothetical protein
MFLTLQKEGVLTIKHQDSSLQIWSFQFRHNERAEALAKACVVIQWSVRISLCILDCHASLR